MRRASGLVVACVLAAGCGRGTGDVQGTVVYADAPGQPATDLKGYVVTFESAGDGPPVGGSGEVQADGTFRVSTFGNDDGAAVGPQKVVVTPPLVGDGVMAAWKIDPKYGKFATSGLTVDVTGGTNRVTLTLDRPPGKGAGRKAGQ